jgi:hypothetical protein
MEDDFETLALKIEWAKIEVRRNMPEEIGVGLRRTDKTFLQITDRLATLHPGKMFFCKICISLFRDLRSLKSEFPQSCKM